MARTSVSTSVRAPKSGAGRAISSTRGNSTGTAGRDLGSASASPPTGPKETPPSYAAAGTSSKWQKRRYWQRLARRKRFENSSSPTLKTEENSRHAMRNTETDAQPSTSSPPSSQFIPPNGSDTVPCGALTAPDIAHASSPLDSHRDLDAESSISVARISTPLETNAGRGKEAPSSGTPSLENAPVSERTTGQVAAGGNVAQNTRQFTPPTSNSDDPTALADIGTGDVKYEELKGSLLKKPCNSYGFIGFYHRDQRYGGPSTWGDPTIPSSKQDWPETTPASFEGTHICTTAPAHPGDDDCSASDKEFDELDQVLQSWIEELVSSLPLVGESVGVATPPKIQSLTCSATILSEDHSQLSTCKKGKRATRGGHKFNKQMPLSVSAFAPPQINFSTADLSPEAKYWEHKYDVSNEQARVRYKRRPNVINTQNRGGVSRGKG